MRVQEGKCEVCGKKDRGPLYEGICGYCRGGLEMTRILEGREKAK